MRYRYAVIYSRFRWRRSGTRSYIADLVDCRLWLLGGSHLLKRLDITAINGYNRVWLWGRLSYDRRIPDHTLTIWYQITHCLLELEHARARVRPHTTHPYARIRAGRAGSCERRGELDASWARAGKFDTSWKMCYNKAVIKERSCYYDPSRLD